MSDWKELRAKLLEDPATRAAYDAASPRYDLASMLIALRAATGLSQRELARRIGMTQSEISRIEAARVHPSWETVSRLLSAVDAEVEVRVRDASGKRVRVPLPLAAPAGSW